jgi:hypothetical protein
MGRICCDKIKRSVGGNVRCSNCQTYISGELDLTDLSFRFFENLGLCEWEITKTGVKWGGKRG